MTSHRFVVMGTDTGVGKTHVGEGLSAAWRAQGHDVVALKPIESGIATVSWEQEDGVRLARATGQASPECALQRLQAPIAPPAAAEKEGKTLSFAGMLDSLRKAEGDAEVTLIEGAGGVLSPLTWEHTALDLAQEMDASVILVASDALGSMNQVRTALRVLWGADLEVVAVILSASTAAQDPSLSNQDGLSRVPEAIHAHLLPRTANVEETADHLSALARELVA